MPICQMAQKYMVARIVGAQPQPPLQSYDPFFRLPGIVQRRAEHNMSDRVAGVKLDRPATLGDRLGPVLRPDITQAQHPVCMGIAVIERDRAMSGVEKRGERLFAGLGRADQKVTVMAVGKPGVGLAVVWIEFDRPLKRLARLDIAGRRELGEAPHAALTAFPGVRVARPVGGRQAIFDAFQFG